MRLPEIPWRHLLHKEVRGLLAGRAFWVLLLVQSLLTGAGFTQALALYGEASRTAVSAPELAVGLSPLEGVLVPTFGSLYLGLTLLFPFVAIRQLARERSDGTLALLLQTPTPFAAWLLAKLAALGLAAAALLAIPASALALWLAQGGHLALGETLTLLLGYALYAFLVAGLAWLAAALMDSAAGAAILVLSATLGSWALDFAAAGDRGLWHSLGVLSLTAVLRRFEGGLLGSADLAGLLLAGGVAMAGAAIWLGLGPPRRRLGRIAGVATLATVLALLAVATAVSLDATENRRHSFAPADQRTLATLSAPLRLTVYLSPVDPRLSDLERNVLDKLGRALPNLEVQVLGTGGAFAAPVADPGADPGADQGEDRYGLIELDYRGRRAQTRSTSPREILPLIYDLAGASRAPDTEAPTYPGYPLIGGARPAALWFFLLLPAVIGLGWWTQRD